ncbi:hypothetical protein HYV12_03190 [Candidatus Dojkabacteria bacterium]|nr:hypothetical protein [Candidatus Dojkabacteria bacterium]
MKSFSINDTGREESINCILLEQNSKDLIIFIGGDGDTKDTYLELGKKISDSLKQDLLLFSFRGRESGKSDTPTQLISDLEELVAYINRTYRYNSISLISTSSGSIPMTYVLANQSLSKHFKQAVYLDPADYYTTQEGLSIHPDTWTGIEEYNPRYETVSTMMKQISSGVKVYVVNFTIRNTEGDRYVEVERRGLDNPNKYTRLNNDMVKSFYSNTPERNRGEYIEESTLPHAFERDGNISKNEEKILEILKLTCK